MRFILVLLILCLIGLHCAEEKHSLRASGTKHVSDEPSNEDISLIKWEQKAVKRKNRRIKNIKKSEKKIRKKWKNKRISRKNNEKGKNAKKKNSKKSKRNGRTKNVKPKQKKRERKRKREKKNMKKGKKKSKTGKKKKKILKKYIKKIKKKKQNRRKKERKPAVPVQRHFTCGSRLILQYMKDFSQALVQSQRTIRISKKPLLMTEYHGYGRFDDIYIALGLATGGGTSCPGNPARFLEVLPIFTNLGVCKSDMWRCNLFNNAALPPVDQILPGLTTSWKQRAADCKPKLKKFVNEYRESIFKNEPNLTTACGNLEGGVITVGPAQLIAGDCLPKTFQTLNRDVEDFFRKCKDPYQTFDGSWGTCNQHLLAAIDLVEQCSTAACGPAFAALMASYDNYVYQFWYIDNFNLWLDMECINIIATPEECAACSVATNNPQVTCGNRRKYKKPNKNKVNFNATVAAMKEATADGTTCSGAPIPEDAKNVYNILKSCSNPKLPACDPTPLITKWKEINGSTCYSLIDEFITEYQAITNRTNSAAKETKLTEKLKEIIKTPLSGYNLKLIRECVPHFCYTPKGCALGPKALLVTTLSELNKEFLISFEFVARLGNVLQLIDLNKNPVLSFTVDHKNGIFCSYTYENDTHTCNLTENVFTPGVRHHIVISQTLDIHLGKYFYRVRIDGVEELEVESVKGRAFSNGISVYTNWNSGVETDTKQLSEYLRNLFINTNWPSTNLCEVPSFTMYATCDNVMKLFADGKLLATSTSWTKSTAINIPAKTKIIQIDCEDKGVLGGIVASSNTSIKTDKTWTCSSDGGITWNPAYEIKDNDGWAVECCGYPEKPVDGISAYAKWIWTGPNDWHGNHEHVSCKIDLGTVIVTPVTNKSNDINKLNELVQKLEEANCLNDEFNNLEAERQAVNDKCTDATVVGSYANCVANEKAATAYITACKIIPACSFTTTSSRRRSLKKLKLI